MARPFSSRPQSHVALYGGSFDPPHFGHQSAVLYLLSCAGADQVWVIPSWHHPLGKTQTPFEVRLRMCQAMIEPFGRRVAVSAVERDIASDGKTLFLIEHLRRENPNVDFTLAVGADNVQIAHQWYRWDEIQRLVRVLVLGREGFPQPGTVTLPGISSTDIRQRVVSGEAIDHLVPAAVAAIIITEGLYRASS
jgi:nicotinate-nucleotide adenylyltransferase